MNRVGLQTDAFAQLTTGYMNEVFNREVPDDPDVSYRTPPSNALPVLTAQPDTIPTALAAAPHSTASGGRPIG